jgi:hypothetical protein
VDATKSLHQRSTNRDNLVRLKDLVSMHRVTNQLAFIRETRPVVALLD